LTPDRILTIVNVGYFVLAFAVPVGIFLLPRPRNEFGRAAIALIFTWAATVFYAGLVVNPVGIAAGHAVGEHFPEARYDNNTIASAMIGGWLAPLISIVAVAIIRRARVQKSAPLDERTPNKSLERTREG